MSDETPPTPPTEPEEKPEPRLPMILTLADITGWDIGPGRESDCQLTLKVTVKDFENTRLIRALAAGKVVLRLLPLQMRLGDKSGEPMTVDVEGCAHGGELWPFSPTMKVCMECGLVLEVPKQPDLPESSEGSNEPEDPDAPAGTDSPETPE
jgi:hypothetical protein